MAADCVDLYRLARIQLWEDFQETLVSLSCFPHVLFVLLRKRGHVALAEGAHLRVVHYVSTTTAANDQRLCARLSGLTTLRGFYLNQPARHWQFIDGVFVDSFHDQ